jgi:hypothetical protein
VELEGLDDRLDDEGRYVRLTPLSSAAFEPLPQTSSFVTSASSQWVTWAAWSRFPHPFGRRRRTPRSGTRSTTHKVVLRLDLEGRPGRFGSRSSRGRFRLRRGRRRRGLDLDGRGRGFLEEQGFPLGVRLGPTDIILGDSAARACPADRVELEAELSSEEAHFGHRQGAARRGRFGSLGRRGRSDGSRRDRGNCGRRGRGARLDARRGHGRGLSSAGILAASSGVPIVTRGRRP